jgi:hypothetical protein
MKKTLLSLTACLLMQGYLQAQGCSDAGFCSLSYRSALSSKPSRNTLRIDASYNIGENQTSVWVLSPEYSYRFSKNITWNNKLTVAYMNGAFGRVLNAGDLYSTLNIVPGGKNEKTVSLLAGIKIPLTQSNDKINTVALPMVYQSSLGTYDLIAGVSIPLKNWEIQGAVQLPVINRNRNSFLTAFSPIPGYLNTNLFQRKADGLFRAGYTIATRSGNWRFYPNLLGIYHFGNDSYEDMFGKRTTISGSDGLTVNMNLQATRKLRGGQELKLSVASPILVRDARPDGLTRSLVVSAAYQFGW